MKSVETNYGLRRGLRSRGLRCVAAALAVACGVLLSGCVKDHDDCPSGGAAVKGVPVTLSFSSEGPLHAVDKGAAAGAAAAFASGTAPAPVTARAATRGVLNPSAVDEWAVADLWVLQYDMSGGTAGSLAARRYVASAVQDGANVRVTADLEPMEKARIVVLANVPGAFSENDLPTGSTLAELDALTFPVNATGGNSVPDDYSSALPMRGDSGDDLKLEMGQVATVRVPLYRLVSKLNFTVDNRCAEGYPRLTLTSVSLRNVPAVGCYARVIESTHASTRYPAATGDNFKDYEALTENLGSHCELLWYLAPNSRGTGSGTKPADKTADNAPDGEGDYCTYAYVQGMLEQSEGDHLIPMSYRVYLGGNATNDYNVWANEAYRIKMTIWELPEGPEIEVGHDGFTVELSGPDGSYDNPVEGWEILVEGATVTPDPSSGITSKGGSYTFTVFGTFSGTVPVRITSGGTVLASGNASQGAGVKLTLPENTSAQSRTVNFEYNPAGSWTTIKSGVQQGSTKPAGDVVDAGNVWVDSNYLGYTNWNTATSNCSSRGMRLPSRQELYYILGNRDKLGLKLRNPCAYWSHEQSGSSYAYGVEASDSRTTYYHWKTDLRCSICVKTK